MAKDNGGSMGQAFRLWGCNDTTIPPRSPNKLLEGDTSMAIIRHPETGIVIADPDKIPLSNVSVPQVDKELEEVYGN